MSTDYSHFTNLAFDRLFAHGPDGTESLIINSSGIFVGFTISGSLTVNKVTANGVVIGSAANTVAHVNTLKSTGTLTITPGNSLINMGSLTELDIGGMKIGDASKRINQISTLLSTGVLTVTTTGGASINSVIIGSAANVVAHVNTLKSTGVLTVTTTGGATINSVIIGSAANTVAHVNTLKTTGTLAIKGNTTISGTLSVSGSIAGLPAASTAATGVVNTLAQTFHGNKAFQCNASGSFRVLGSDNVVLIKADDNSDAVTIGSSASLAITILNNTLATNGAQTATTLNLPAAATSGNPFGWLTIKINGVNSYIPFWH